MLHYSYDQIFCKIHALKLFCTEKFLTENYLSIQKFNHKQVVLQFT